MSDRLFSPRFFIMFGFSFTVFLSVFQLLPTAPYRVLGLGGSTAVAGLFQGLLTFASAASAPVAGTLSDRIGHRRILIGVSLALAAFSASYALITSYQLLLTVVVFHGAIWSALLSASGAYMAATVPATRRGEGLGYWGLASVLAMGTAPAVGFWVYRHGWMTLCIELCVLNLLMAAIAWALPDDEDEAADRRMATRPVREARDASVLRRLQTLVTTLVEWRVMLLSVATAMASFGYGGLTSFSALFADSLGLSPRSLFLSVMALSTAVGRLTFGRSLDAIGPRRVFLRAAVAPPIGLLLLSVATNLPLVVAAACVFGLGFGLLLPSYNTYVLSHVSPLKRGAAFGAMLAAFDSGIGAGSSALGWLAQHFGFRTAFATAAVVALLALPYFVVVERALGFVGARVPSEGAAS